MEAIFFVVQLKELIFLVLEHLEFFSNDLKDNLLQQPKDFGAIWK